MRTRQTGQVQFGIIFDAAQAIVGPLLYVFSDRLAVDFLFSGKVEAGHKTKFALERFVTRYADSIESLNRALVASVVFVPIALLPVGETMKIPLIDLQVTTGNWLRLAPAISFGLQIFSLIGLCWFLLMRRGFDVLKREVGEVDYFGDVSNIMLTGVLGSLWILISVQRHFRSKLQLIWFLPLVALLVLLMLSPTILCGYFVRELFVVKDFLPAVTYAALLVPSMALSLALTALGVVAGIREVWASSSVAA